MCLEGIQKASRIIANGGSALDAVEIAIREAEDFPLYKSVGYGGLPNECCEVELDAAFMDGDTFSFGAVAGIRDIKNPISVARRLSLEQFNIFLVGAGAEEVAHKNFFERKNMLTERAKKMWEIRMKKIKEENLSPYDGHDTVGIVALDASGSMSAGTSTSGLFMKRRGRVGDSPICGAGLYVDSKIGGAVATGLGEDIMKGCLSYEVVRLMEEGLDPIQASQKSLQRFISKMQERGRKVGAISLICLNNEGKWGVGTNVEFSFVVVDESNNAKVYLAKPVEGKVIVEEASSEWLRNYEKRLHNPLELMS
jgi:N4-(beta-N-acetylglucosaminyl)-L-asparaginase